MDLSLTVCLTILSNRQLLELVEVRSEMHCTTQLLVTSCSYAHLFGEVTKRALYLVKGEVTNVTFTTTGVQRPNKTCYTWIMDT